MLLDAREIAEHGAWLPFLAEAGIHERTARRMMVLSPAGLKSDTVSDLGGIRATLADVDGAVAVQRLRDEIADTRAQSEDREERIAILIENAEPEVREHLEAVMRREDEIDRLKREVGRATNEATEIKRECRNLRADCTRADKRIAELEAAA